MRTPSPKQCHSNPWSFEGISGQSAAWSDVQKLFRSFSVSYCTVFSYIRCKQSSSKLILVKMNICQCLFNACSTKLLFIVFSASFGSNNFICSGMFEYVLVCSCSVQCWNKYVCVPFQIDCFLHVSFTMNRTYSYSVCNQNICNLNNLLSLISFYREWIVSISKQLIAPKVATLQVKPYEQSLFD